MLKAHGTFAFILILFTSLNLWAQLYEMNASYFVRSSPDFGRRDKNKVGVLNKGDQFTVLKTETRSDGAEALQIQVTRINRKVSHLSDSETYWIYKPNNRDFILKDNRTTQADASAIPCTDCDTPAPPGNARDIADLSRRITGDQNTPAPNNGMDAKIKNYSESDEVQRTIDWAMKNKSARSRGYCYRTVKEALANKCGPNIVKGKKTVYRCSTPAAKPGQPWAKGNNLTTEMYSDLAAADAKESLKKYGFVNLLEVSPYKQTITSPSLAPKGAVLVYSSGTPCKGQTRERDCGHIEIKVDEPGKPGFVSDYYSSDAVNETAGEIKRGTKYKLIGVMIKPMD